jgi:acyl-CoA thioesterase FadM
MSDETFPWVEDVRAPEAGRAGHIDNIQIAQLMYDAWMRYLLEGVGLSPSVFDTEGRPTVREITAAFDAEIFPGDQLECGVRAVARSRRSFTLRQVLRRKDTGDQVASGTVVLVTIDPATWRPVEVPAAIWNEIERAEQKAIPVTSR